MRSMGRSALWKKKKMNYGRPRGRVVLSDALVEGREGKPKRSSKQKGADEEDAGHLESGIEDEFFRRRRSSCSIGCLGVCAERNAVVVVVIHGVEGVHGVVAVVHWEGVCV